jgi:hypothetical protein
MDEHDAPCKRDRFILPLSKPEGAAPDKHDPEVVVGDTGVLSYGNGLIVIFDAEIMIYHGAARKRRDKKT